MSIDENKQNFSIASWGQNKFRKTTFLGMIEGSVCVYDVNTALYISYNLLYYLISYPCVKVRCLLMYDQV